MYGKFQQHLQDELKAIEQAGLYKKERNIASPQSAEITLEDGKRFELHGFPLTDMLSGSFFAFASLCKKMNAPAAQNTNAPVFSFDPILLLLNSITGL